MQSDAVGSCHPDDEYRSAAIYHKLLMDTNSIAPSTFGSLHSGQGCTWQSRQNARHRIDFISIPLHWESSVTSSEVDTVLDVVGSKKRSLLGRG